MNNQRPSTLAIGERKTRVVVRGTTGKRRSKTVPLTQKVTLERVLGISLKDSCALTCDTKTGHVAYIAGCVIVIFNPRKNRQFHIVNQSRKTLTALSFSGDGRYLVSGECGHNPAVRIWDVQEKTQVAEFHGHKFGISCVAFSPNMQYMVSVGEQHDMVVNVWDWKNNTKHSSGKIATKVTGLAFSEDGSFFVVVGNRCVKFYYLMGKSRTRQILALPGRSGILGEQKNNFFCSVACGKGENEGKVYAVTKSGFLCEINSNRLLDKWVDLRTTSAHSLAADEEFVFVACDSGVIRLFSASTLHFVATLPKPHNLGVNVSAGIDASHMPAPRDNALYPDAVAITFDDENKKLTAVYSDHSLYMWDIHDVRKIGKQWSFLYHSACVFGVETYPELSDGNRAALPPGSFFTCSSDGTIRIWNVDPTMNTNITKRNIYSNELLKVLYVCDESMETLQDKEYNPAGTTDKTDPEKGKSSGIRCIKVSPDGQTLASGDRSGNVRVHDLQFFDQLHEIEAHDSEVLCLEYTQPNTGYNLLASASRDRLIHVFDIGKSCSLVQTLDDHSSSITSVKFNMNGEQLQMVSCGADKALMFRMAVNNPDLQFVRNHHVVGKTTLYDLAIDTTQKYITTACQDRNLRIYNMASGKLKRTYKGAQSDEGTLIRVELDPSGIYAATSCSDKSLNIYDFYSGECVATMVGHSELVTGIKFTSDCKQLISVSGDGCIFIWKLPWELTHNMKERLKEMGEKIVEPPPEYNLLRRGTYVVPPSELPVQPKGEVMSAWQAQAEHTQIDFHPAMQSRPDTEDEMEEKPQPDEESKADGQNFDTGLLPLWAQKQVSTGVQRVFEECPVSDIPSPTSYRSPTHPRGRWAQNIHSGSITVKSQISGEFNQSIELRIDDCLDRRRYTVEPDTLLEQVRPFSSLKGPFAGMDAEENQMRGFVTTSRGSDPFVPPASLRASGTSAPADTNGTFHSSSADHEDGTNVEDIEGDDEEEEEEEEEEEDKDDDTQDKIIFYPQEEDQSSSPESLKFQVTASTKSHEQLAKRNSMRQKVRDNSKENLTAPDPSPKPTPSQETSTDENDEDDADESDADDEDEEEEEEEEEGEGGNKTPTASPRRKPTPIEPPSPSSSPDEQKFLHTNFSFAEKEKDEDKDGEEEEVGREEKEKKKKEVDDGFVEQEKFGRCLEQLQSGFTSDEVSSGRLSISSRFLSRSQHSHARAPIIASQNVTPVPASMNAEEYLRRRKEEVARAVEETRKRLSSLGWAMGDKKAGQEAPNKASAAPVSGGRVKPAIPPRMNKPPPQAAKRMDTPPKPEPAKRMDAPPSGGTEKSPAMRIADSLGTDSASVNNNNKQSSPPPLPPKPDMSDLNLRSCDVTDKSNDAKGSSTKDDVRTNSGGDVVNDGKNSVAMDSNKFASKESSQDSSPEGSKTSSKVRDNNENSSQEVVGNVESNIKSPKDSILNETYHVESFTNNKTPTRLIKQAAMSPEVTGQGSPEDNSHMQTETADSNKENVSSVSLLNRKTAEGSGGARSDNPEGFGRSEKPKSGGERSKVVGRMSNMRRVASLNDLRQETKDKNESSPSLTPPSQSSYARSTSIERDPQNSRHSPARQRRREGAMLPLLPTPKTRSYEGKTQSSKAKVVRRISESSPPPSPNTLRKKKRSIAGSGGGSPSTLTKPGPMKAIDPSHLADGKPDPDANQDTNSEASVDSVRTEDSCVSTGSKGALGSDRLAMPPPSSTHVSKAKTKKNSSLSKMSERGRKRSASLTNSTAASRARRASTSSLPPSSDSRTKIPTPSDTKSKSPQPAAKADEASQNKATCNLDNMDTSPKPISFPVPAEMVNTCDTTEDRLGGAGELAGTVMIRQAPSGDVEHGQRMDEKKEKEEEKREERKRKKDKERRRKAEEEEDKSSSDDTMVSEAPKDVSSIRPGAVETLAMDAGGETTPDDVRAMRASLRIDLSDISVDEPDEDLGASLRQSVDIMKQAFEQCIKCVTKIEQKGNHKTDLAYLGSAFTNMGNSYKSRVLPVVHRATNQSSDNALSYASDDPLTHSTDVFSATASSISMDTGRSLPSLSELLTGGSRDIMGGIGRGEARGKGAESLDAGSPQALMMLQHYSEMLVNMVRVKMEDESALSGRSRVSSVDLETED